MKIKTAIFLITIFLSLATCFSENMWKPTFQLEFGSNGANSSLNERWSIRQYLGVSDYFDEHNTLYTYMNVAYLGIKPEISFFDNKIAVSSGLRYYNVHCELSSTDYTNDLAAFFYLRYNSSGINTEYAKIYGVYETSHYMGISLDIKLIPISFPNIDIYLKTGLDFGYKISSNTNINFVNSSMEAYEKEILSDLGIKTNNFYSSWNSSIGITYGSRDKLRYSFEILLPSLFISKDNSSLVDSKVYSGVKLLIGLPTK